MTHGLASIFVNNQRVEDLDNPELRIRDIIEAYGRDPERCIVYRLDSEEESAGDPVALNDRVDLSEIRGALFLRCETRRTEAIAPSPEGAGDEEELMEFESVPEYEGPLEEQDSQASAKDEVTKEELLSPTTGPREAEPPWDDTTKSPSSPPRTNRARSAPNFEAPPNPVANPDAAPDHSVAAAPNPARPQHERPRRDARTTKTQRADGADGERRLGQT